MCNRFNTCTQLQQCVAIFQELVPISGTSSHCCTAGMLQWKQHSCLFAYAFFALSISCRARKGGDVPMSEVVCHAQLLAAAGTSMDIINSAAHHTTGTSISLSEVSIHPLCCEWENTTSSLPYCRQGTNI